MELIALLLALSPPALDSGPRPEGRAASPRAAFGGTDPCQGQEHRPEEIEVVRTKTAYTLRADEVQIDGLVSHFEFDEKGRRPEFELSTFQAELAYGITDWLTGEIRVPFLNLDLERGDTERGLGDIGLELKAAVSPNLVPIPLAVGLRVTLTTGDDEEGLGADNTEFTPYAAVSMGLMDWLTGHAQILVEAEEDERTVYGANFAADASPWGPDVSVYLALNGRREVGESPAWSIVPGAQYRWTEKKLHFAVGLPIGLSSAAEDFGFIANVQYAF